MKRNLGVYFVYGAGGEAPCSVTSRELMLRLPEIDGARRGGVRHGYFDKDKLNKLRTESPT